MNSFQRTLRHLVNANNVLAGSPPLHPAPSSIPPPPPTVQPVDILPLPPVPVDHLPLSPVHHLEEGQTQADRYHYTYHQMRESGHEGWKCVFNNKSCRTKGISCSATTVTTGTPPSSSLEYALPHSHLHHTM